MYPSLSTELKDKYFAALEPEKCASILLAKSQSFYNFLRANAYLDKLRDMWRAYHGAYGDYVGFGHQVTFAGEQGELTMLPVNHFRNLAQHMYNMITQNRPVMEARAINNDYKSLAQTYLANGVLDYYMREKGLENALKKAVELAIVLGSGFIKMEWNATAGEAFDFDEETQQYNYEGELEFSTLTPFDVVVDGTKENWDHDWMLIRNFQNRFNLMAKYPELADKIKGLPSKTDSSIYRMAVFSNDETDDIAVYEFYHKRTEAVPEGRYLLFLDDNIVLLDTKMPYRQIPIFRVVPGEILGTPYGYSPMFDIYPIQEALNSLYSTILTNQNAFGVQNIFVPRGADIALSTLDGALNIIEANAKPEPLNLTETPSEVFKFLDVLNQAAETISGVNSVARGNPEANLKSGTALALVQSMALQFISGLQQSYVKLIEEVGTATINILKDYANAPKVIAIAGKNKRSYLKEFTGDQISDINRVVVDVGNPLSRTVAGRVQMAEQLLQMKLLTNPQQYFEVMETGRLDIAYQGEMSQLMLIQQENEKLLAGEPVQAVMFDKHSTHIQEHGSILADPDLRKDPTLTKNVLTHIQEHIDLLRTTDPAILQMIGEQSLNPQDPGKQEAAPSQVPPPQPPQQPQGGGPGGPGGQPMPPQGALNGQIPGAMQPPQQVPPMPGQSVQGPGGGGSLPNLPKPPSPFQTNPVLASQLAPPPR
jgi:hypothetical protein